MRWGWLALVALGCQQNPGPSPSSSPSATGSATGSGSGSPSATGSSLSAPGPVSSLPSVAPRCCRLDRTEGHFGPEKGVHVRYSGDVLLRNDGERLLFPQDLINDTKELYVFAKSAGQSLHQERRLRVVGEGPKHISVSVEDRGETGATTPFFHSKCTTLDVRKSRKVNLDEVLPREQAEALVAEGRRRFEASPGRELFRFVPGSFALTEGAVWFCCSARDDRQPTPRLDVEVPLVGEKLVLHRRRR